MRYNNTTFLLLALLVCAPLAVDAQAPEQPEGDEPPASPTPASPDQKLEEYDSLLRELAGLQVYNALLERQIANQNQQTQELRAAIVGVPALERQVAPLLIRMVDGLERFIELDVPFHLEDRTNSVLQLRSLVERADVTDAEKFRRILEAWQIENEYGNNYDTYQGQLDIGGTAREVDFLRIGRIALIYQTPDLEYTGAWDQRTRAWVTLGGEHRNSVRQGLRMARSQVAPDLLLLPIAPPSAAANN